MKNKTTRRALLVLFAIAAVALVGCENPAGPASASSGSGDGAGNGGETTPPPENLIGTIALDTGEPAVMTLEISGSASRATVGVTGNVRYQGDDYVVGGLYDDETGALDIFAENGAGQRFIFSGTYTTSGGFQGTVELYASDGTTRLAQGSVSAAGADDAEVADVKVFTGTYGGAETGTWNATLTPTSFYGSYASTISGDYGSFLASRTGDSITYSEYGLIANGIVSGDGNFISGSWDSTDGVDSYSGTWSGVAVDSNNDPVSPTSVADTTYLYSAIEQAIRESINQYDFAVDAGDFSDTDADPTTLEGPTINGVTMTVYLDGSVPDYYLYDISYSHAQTGLELTGQLRYELLEADPDDTPIREGVIYDSDATNLTEDTGFLIEFPDASTITMFVDLIADHNDEQFEAYSFADPVWEIGGTDVVDDAEAYYF